MSYKKYLEEGGQLSKYVRQRLTHGANRFRESKADASDESEMESECECSELLINFLLRT